MELDAFFAMSLAGNTMADYARALALLIILALCLRMFKFIVIKQVAKFTKKTKTELDDLLIGAIDTFGWPFFLVFSFYVSLKYLNVDSVVDNWANYVMLGVTYFYAVLALVRFINFFAKKMVKKQGEESRSMLTFLANLAKGTLWLFAILLLLSNLGVNVTSLMAGLGIGGIAVALALQNVLGDLFASVSIFFDKPFKVGDFIIVGEYLGTVKKIGIKTTRIESLWGEEVVISNSELTSTRIRNFKKLKRRRIQFNFGLTYQTKPEKINKANSIVAEVIKSVKMATLDRTNFKGFGNSSFDFEVVYYVESDDYNKYMEIQEQINLGILERFNKEKIEFAYPTRTLFMKK